MAMEHPIFFFGSDALPDLGEGVLPCFGCWMGRWLVLSSSGEQMAQRSQFTSVLGVAWNQQPCGEPARNFLVYWRCPSPKVTECSQLSYGPCGWKWCIPRPIKWFLASTPHQPGLKKNQTQAGMNFDETQNRDVTFFTVPGVVPKFLLG